MQCRFFSSVRKNIHREIQDLHGPCIKRYKQKLSSHLALVGVSLRTAYLVDLFALSDPVSFWENLLTRLRLNPCTQALFSSVIHIFEPSSEQSFIVNVPLLAIRARHLNHSRISSDEGSDNSGHPTFVRLCPSHGFYLLDSVPGPLSRLITEHILPNLQSTSALPLTLTLPAISPTLSVPLAAILLDYSVAYVPDSDLTSASRTGDSLFGVTTVFYECVLSFRDLEGPDVLCDHLNSQRKRLEQRQENREMSCTIMKFSCPAILSETHHKLKSETIIEQLNTLFVQRLQALSDPSLLHVTVYKTIHTLNQLAF